LDEFIPSALPVPSLPISAIRLLHLYYLPPKLDFLLRRQQRIPRNLA
jgi:hypothetical protein